jgi:acetyl esterase/lipase
MNAGFGDVRTIAYGADPAQAGDLYLPDCNGPAVVCLLHGGFWRMAYGRDQFSPHAADLARRGYAAWNLGYRRLGEAGGGWPGTFDDVAAGIDLLGSFQESGIALDLSRVAVVGHSAGGHLALWAAGRRAPAARQQAGRRVRIAAACAVAPVADLALACQLELSNKVTAQLLGGGPDEIAAVFAQASPIELLPFGVPQLVVHGEDDEVVPMMMTERYARRALELGEPVEVLRLANTGHFEILDTRSESWAAVVAFLGRMNDRGDAT